MFDIEWEFEVDRECAEQSEKETGVFPADLKLIII